MQSNFLNLLNELKNASIVRKNLKITLKRTLHTELSHKNSENVVTDENEEFYKTESLEDLASLNLRIRHKWAIIQFDCSILTNMKRRKKIIKK